MKSFAPLLVLAALALSASTMASAEPDRRHGGHGGGQQEWRGGGPGGPGGFEQPGGGRWRGRDEGRPQGPYQGGPQGPPQGPWNGGPRYYAPQGYPAQGPPNGERPRANSLGEGWREQQNEARAGVRSGELRPLGGVLAELRRRQPGRQLDAGIEEGADGRPVYRVRWAAQNGRRIDFIVDARTGAILSEEGR
jgi:hypothetical protein